MLNKIAFIGAGSMAEAIIAGIIKNGILNSEQIFITNNSNQERLNYLYSKYGVNYASDKVELVKDADMIILSMGPGDTASAIDSIKEHVNPTQLIVSVAAGIDTDTIEDLMEMPVPIIRSMPNTSASVGHSSTAISKGRHATDDHVQMSKELFNTIGITEIVPEAAMHAVTAVSGSGPAYVYYLVEAMEKAAIETGLDAEVAKSLITQTIIGVGEMLKTTGETAENLKDRVTSPGGTTEAGLNTLMEYNFNEAILECIKSATNRSIELGK